MTAANKARGEARVILGGQEYTARLSLDALARLEDAFGVEDFGDALAKVFGVGDGLFKVRARNLLKFLTCVVGEKAAGSATAGEALDAAMAIMEVGGFKVDSPDEKASTADPLGGKSAGSSGAGSASATSGSRRKRSGRSAT